MERTKQMIIRAWILTALLVALPGCFMTGPPEVYKCTQAKPGCPEGFACDPKKKECVKDGTKLDGSVDGPVADAGKDLSVDVGKDTGKDMALPDTGMDAGTDQALPDNALPDVAIPDLPLADLKVVPDQTVPDMPIPDLPVPDLPISDLPIPDQALPDQKVYPDLAIPDANPCGTEYPVAGCCLDNKNLKICYKGSPQTINCPTVFGQPYCGWNSTANSYGCGAINASAPGNSPPRKCPGIDASVTYDSGPPDQSVPDKA